MVCLGGMTELRVALGLQYLCGIAEYLGGTSGVVAISAKIYLRSKCPPIARVAH
jgi:hypothetical protein